MWSVIGGEILGWSCFWGVVWYITNLNGTVPTKFRKEEDPAKQEQLKKTHFGYYLSLYHACMTIAASVISLLWYGFAPSAPFSEFDFWIFKMSAGYFVVDTITGMAYKFNDLSMLLHHIFVLTAYAQAFYYNNSRVELTLSLAVGELSNPLNIVRILADDHGMKRLSEYCALGFTLVFVTLRGLCSWLILSMVNLNPALNNTIKLICTLLCRLA